MAIQVVFEGFVNEVKALSWGNVAKVSHSQRAKNDAGEWETVGRDYFDVTLPDGVNVNDGSLVKVVGTLKVGTYEKNDGSTGVSLKVRATEVAPVERGQAAPAASKPADIPSSWTPVSEDAPF